jgi:hypothetical protein
VIRVRNEAASLGHDHAITAARFDPLAGGVAVWPLTTAAEAAATHEQVDQGHPPWMLEPSAVADSFARAELCWVDVEVNAATRPPCGCAGRARPPQCPSP